VFEITVLRRIFGSKRDGITREWRMRNFMICTPQPLLLGNKIEKNGMGGHVAHKGERRGV